jgi:exopolysaccharide biosynthesis protein
MRAPTPAPTGSGTIVPGVTYDRTAARTIITVDLQQPGIGFAATGRAPNWADGGTETVRQTTKDFIGGIPNAVAAINGDLYGSIKIGSQLYANLSGLNISAGTLVSGFTSGGNAGTFLLDATGPRIQITSGGVFPDLANVSYAVSGIAPLALENGIVTPGGTALASRSQLGLSADARYLFLLSTGSNSVTIAAAAQMLLDAGASSAVNLDGGGSSSLWWKQAGTLTGWGSRAVGSSFAITAT